MTTFRSIALVILVSLFTPFSFSQIVDRDTMLVTPFNQVVTCDPNNVFALNEPTILATIKSAALFKIRLIGADSNGDQLVQIGCRDSAGNFLGWFHEPSPGTFVLSTSDPIPTDASTLFAQHLNGGGQGLPNCPESTSCLRIYYKTPSGNWMAFTNFNEPVGPYNVALWQPGIKITGNNYADPRCNFVLFYEGADLNSALAKYITSIIACQPRPGGDAAGMCDYWHTQDHESYWVRGSASLDVTTNLMTMDLQLETDSNGSGPLGHIEVQIQNAAGKVILDGIYGPHCLNGKAGGSAKRVDYVDSKPVPGDVAKSAWNLVVSAHYDDSCSIVDDISSTAWSIIKECVSSDDCRSAVAAGIGLASEDRADLPRPRVSQVIPQIAMGSFDGGSTSYSTIIEVVNPGGDAVTISGQFVTENGTALNIPLTTNVVGLSSVQGSFSSITLAPGNIMVISSSSFNGSGTVGWAQVISSGDVMINTVFEYRSGFNGILLSRTGVAASAPSLRQFLVPRIFNSSGFDVGIALVNTASAAKTITATLVGPTGQVIATKQITLNANQHLAKYAQEIFATSAGAGNNYSYIAFSSDSASWAAVGLGIEGSSISSFPITPVSY